TRRLLARPKIAGVIAALLVLFATGGVAFIILLAVALISPIAFFICSTILLYTTVAARDLIQHAEAVYAELTGAGGEGDIDLATARKRVAMLVGRDTEQLDEAGIIRACIESVAENMSDGVVAPVFWAFFGAVIAVLTGNPQWASGAAAVAAMLYKAVNTMDSMFGYKNEQYLDFGWFAARFDDLVNYLPARLTGVSLVVATIFTGHGTHASWRIFRRDCKKHTSPNAGFPEAAMAGALGIVLGGGNWYFGSYVQKPELGDSLHLPVADHVRQANRLMLIGFFLAVSALTLCYILVAFN
ncbi:MAG: cobalamin biosynthesis protein CobD, partial [Desulfobulbaceae bacterium]|nr:cobalamin biosynthesis protein CobD [Desulfobulbaceae bacterium]